MNGLHLITGPMFASKSTELITQLTRHKLAGRKSWAFKPAIDTRSGDTIRSHLERHVAKWWLPDAIEFVDQLPHTGTGKLSKKTLRDQFRHYRFAGAEAMTGRD